MNGITCLIPAFKIRYFSDLLTSLKTQCVPPSRVIVSDDTQCSDFFKLLLESKTIRDQTQSLRVELVRGPRNGHQANIEFLLALFQENPSEFFHIMLDDDLIYPDFYKTHIDAHLETYSFCSISRRYNADEQGLPNSRPRLPKELADFYRKTNLIDSRFLVSNTIEPRMGNWLGELSCAVIRKEYVQDPGEFCILNGISFAGLNDLGTWLKCSLQYRLIFLNQFCGSRRFTPRSITGLGGYFYSLSILARVPLAIVFYDLNKIHFVDLIAILKQTKSRWTEYYGIDSLSKVLEIFDNLESEKAYSDFKNKFLVFWNHYRRLENHLVDLRTKQDLIDYLINYSSGITPN
jgi:hypothetical protein